MILTVQPLRRVENVLVQMGDAFTVETDWLNSRRATVELCKERHWEISPRSETLARCVSSETAPNYVAKSEGGVLLAIWIGAVA